MIFKNGIVCDENFLFVRADIKTEGDKIVGIGRFEGDEVVDCTDKVILPGFIDIHIHGCNNADCTDGNPDSVLKMSEYLAGRGVTSFCPATMTVPAEDIRKSFGYIRDAMGKEKGAYVQGINMEGPFISKEKKGAQAEENIIPPDIEFFNELYNICSIRLVDIAPETEGAEQFIGEAKKKCTVSAAHTTADFKMGMKGFEWGISHCTHLFNAMTGLSSRAPGLVGACFDHDSVTAELICDGIHISPATLRIAFRVLGKDRTVVISDAMMASGLPEGEYMLGGQRVIKTDAARLPDGTLAGSATDLFEEFGKLVNDFGIPLEQAVRSVSINPARVIGADRETGSIKEGKSADFFITDNCFSRVYETYVKGKRVF